MSFDCSALQFGQKYFRYPMYYCHWHNSLKRSEWNKMAPFLGFLNISNVSKIFYYACAFQNDFKILYLPKDLHIYIYIYIRRKIEIKPVKLFLTWPCVIFCSGWGVSKCTHTHTHIHTLTHACIYIYIYMCVCVSFRHRNANVERNERSSFSSLRENERF